MVPEEWPISTPPANAPAEPARSAGGDRLPTVLVDFFLDSSKRLTEQERALMGVLLDGLVGWIADEIGARLPGEALAANDGDRHAVSQRLIAAGLVQRADLVALLLRRADEERIAAAVRASNRSAAPFLQKIIASPDPDLSAAAMELILARGRRRDRYGHPRVEFDDLSTDLARALCFAVAAALRPMPIAMGLADADRQLAGAATDLLDRHDAHKGSAMLARNVVRALAERHLLDEAAIGGMLAEGDILLLAEALALRAGIDGSTAWQRISCGGNGRLVQLLRAAGVSRQFAAEVMALVGNQTGISDPGEEIGRFDTLADAEVQADREWAGLDPEYRNSVQAIGRAHA